MPEKLTQEAMRMCVKCTLRAFDGTCSIEGRSINTQNELAESGECKDARVSGPLTRYPKAFHQMRGSKTEVVGRMKKFQNGAWDFQGGFFS